jgi:hypothetical protein
VMVYHGTVESPYASHNRYRIALAGEGRSVYLTEFSTPRQAIERAEEIGRYLQMPIEIDPTTKGAICCGC